MQSREGAGQHCPSGWGTGRTADGMTPGTVSLIKSCFTGQDELIERAYRRIESFRILCEDYLACSASLERWNRSASEIAPLRRREYADLLAELDREIRCWLEAVEAVDVPENGPDTGE